jgi:hypothetical protein
LNQMLLKETRLANPFRGTIDSQRPIGDMREMVVSNS